MELHDFSNVLFLVIQFSVLPKGFYIIPLIVTQFGPHNYYLGRDTRPIGVQIRSISRRFEENLVKSCVDVPLEGWRRHIGEILDLPLDVVIVFCPLYQKQIK